MKKGVVLLLILLCLTLFSCVQETHLHSFSDTWAYDDNYHWHEATCEHKQEIANKAKHSWDAGTIKRAPSFTQEGEVIYACTICGATKTALIQKTPHEHSWSTDFIVLKKPECNVAGLSQYTCTICGKTENKIMNPLGGSHEYEPGVFSYDDYYHWQECIKCEHEENKNPHVLSDPVVILSPSCTAQGTSERTCLICGSIIQESIPNTGHNFDLDTWLYDDEYHYHGCVNSDCSMTTNKIPHSYESFLNPSSCTENGTMGRKCSICGHIEEETTLSSIGHDWGTSTYEWIESASGYDCFAKRICKNNASHIEEEAANVSYAITSNTPCSESGFITYSAMFTNLAFASQKKVIEVTGHVPAVNWTSNDSEHWHSCERDPSHRLDVASHSWDVTVTKKASCIETGIRHYKCKLCGYEKDEIIPIDNTAHYLQLTHNWEEGTRTEKCLFCGIENTETISIGSKGPAGGTIFYIKPNYSEGWKYLEAAPTILEKVVFGYARSSSEGDNLFVNGETENHSFDCTEPGKGTGKTNTEMLYSIMGDSTYTKERGTSVTSLYAAKECIDFNYGGYDDWFLPSQEELDLLFIYKKSSYSGASGDYFWSSTESTSSPNLVYRRDMAGSFGYGNRSGAYKVWPIRSF